MLQVLDRPIEKEISGKLSLNGVCVIVYDRTVRLHVVVLGKQTAMPERFSRRENNKTLNQLFIAFFPDLIDIPLFPPHHCTTSWDVHNRNIGLPPILKEKCV